MLPLNGNSLMWPMRDLIDASGDMDETFNPFHLAVSAERSPMTTTSTFLIDVKNLFIKPRSMAILMECLTAVGQVSTTQSNLERDRSIMKSVKFALSIGKDVNKGTKTKSAFSVYGRQMGSHPSEGAKIATHFFILLQQRECKYLTFPRNMHNCPICLSFTSGVLMKGSHSVLHEFQR